MEPPPGFVSLRDATDMVGRKISTDWCSIGKIAVLLKWNAEVELVITKIAEACEAGEIDAVYPSVTGMDSLPRDVWHRPDWRRYFANGTIDLDLPLVDYNLRPIAGGHTEKCTREIFLRRQHVNQLVRTLVGVQSRDALPVAAGASVSQIADIVSQYEQSLKGANPSIPGLEHFAKRCGLIGHREKLRAEYKARGHGQRRGPPSKSS